MLAGLPEAHREVLLMRFVDGLALEEISVALDIPLGTVKSRIHNAVAALRKDPRVLNYFGPAKIDLPRENLTEGDRMNVPTRSRRCRGMPSHAVCRR